MTDSTRVLPREPRLQALRPWGPIVLTSFALLTANVWAQDRPGVAPAPVTAPQARPLADDPALEERVMIIAAELRCLVCQNETIAASHADLAKDLRDQVREQLRAGRSEREILDYMVARYGDFVLYRPPVKTTTWLLWGGPFALLVVTLLALGWTWRKRRAQGAAAPLSAAEQRRAQAMLERGST